MRWSSYIWPQFIKSNTVTPDLIFASALISIPLCCPVIFSYLKLINSGKNEAWYKYWDYIPTGLPKVPYPPISTSYFRGLIVEKHCDFSLQFENWTSFFKKKKMFETKNILQLISLKHCCYPFFDIMHNHITTVHWSWCCISSLSRKPYWSNYAFLTLLHE